LAGTRLEASLLDSLTEPEEFLSAGHRIESASARAGSLLASIRPLLDPAGVAITTVDPLDVLSGLRSGLDKSVDHRVAIPLRSAVDLPLVRLPVEPVHHLIGSAIYYGLEAGGKDGRVQVRAHIAGGDVVFEICDGGSVDTVDGSGSLRGRSLLLAIARVLVAPVGGHVDAAAHGDGTKLSLAFPSGAP
jgi:hypothetical protein